MRGATRQKSVGAASITIFAALGNETAKRVVVIRCDAGIFSHTRGSVIDAIDNEMVVWRAIDASRVAVVLNDWHHPALPSLVNIAANCVQRVGTVTIALRAVIDTVKPCFKVGLHKVILIGMV